MSLRVVKPANKKRFTPVEAYARVCRFCAYQERSHKEVRTKLFSYGLFAAEVDELIAKLITDGFLNEERFAKAFAGGKFRMQKWGRNKIAHELEAHGLTRRCIERGLDEIDHGEYTKTLRVLITRKLSERKESDPLRAGHKAGTYAIAKGYEAELVWPLVKELTD